MASIFSKPKAPPPIVIPPAITEPLPPPAPLPDPEDVTLRARKRRAAAARGGQRSGRQSTILSDAETLG